MDVHGADVAAVLVAPDQVQQIFPGIDPVGIADKQLHHVKFAGRQVHRHAVLIDVVLPRVDGNGADGDTVVLGLIAAAATKQGADPRFQFQNIKGLGQIVVRAMFKAQQLVHILGAGSEHDDGNIGKFPDSAAGLQPVDLRHHDIQDDEPDLRVVGQLHRLPAVGASNDLITVVLQIKTDALYEQFFIVNYQYLHKLPPQ